MRPRSPSTRSGNLLVGTESPGKVIRVDADGKGFVLLDTPYPGNPRASLRRQGPALRGGDERPSRRRAAPSSPGLDRTVASETGRALVPSVSVSTEITSIAIVDGDRHSTTVECQLARIGGRRKARSTASCPDGLWDLVWDSREDVPYDVTFDRTGAPIIATGNKGKLYRLEGEPLRPTLLTRASAQQVTGVLQRPARPGLFRDRQSRESCSGCRPNTHHAARIESEPSDAQMLATWGTLSWRGTVPKDSGSSSRRAAATPKRRTKPGARGRRTYFSSDGSAITSPKARYLQWRAVLTGSGDGPVLTSVTAAYLQRNLRPVVRSITVHPPGIVFQKPFTTGEPDLAGFGDQTTPDRRLSRRRADDAAGRPRRPALGRRTYQKGLQTLVWRADDENDDDLVYDVLYRREGETEWTPLRRGIDEPIFVWDTTMVPNGTYFVRVVASDSPSNPAGAALTGERDSTAFLIDHTPPAIVVSSVRVGRRPDDARRSTSTTPIRRCPASSTRATAACTGRRCFRKTELPTRRPSATR